MTELTWFAAARLVGAAIGAALLWGVFSSALKRRGPALPLLVLVSAVAIWYSGEALAILIGHAIPGSASVGYAWGLARIGLSFVPSALVGTVLVFALEAEVPIALRLRRRLILVVFLPASLVLLFWQVLG